MSMISRKSIARIGAALGLFGVLTGVLQAQFNEMAPPRFPMVTCEELKEMIESKAADFLVVSNDPQESYDEAHIPGAVSFPWATQLKLPITLPRNKTLVLYCSCAHEEDSTDMAVKLSQRGYRNLKLLEGGFLRWSELKYPVETNK